MSGRRARMAALTALLLLLTVSSAACSGPLAEGLGLARPQGETSGTGPPLPMSPGGLASNEGPGYGWSDQPVLSVTKKLLTGKQAQFGSTVQFVISIRNMGSRELTIVRVTDTYDPTQLSYEGATLAPDRWLAEGVMVWENVIGDIPLRPGETKSVIVSFDVVVEPEKDGSVEATNHVSVVAFDSQGHESLAYTATEAVRIVGPEFSGEAGPEGETGSQPPVAEVGGPSEGTIGQELTFEAGESSDDHESLVSYLWSFGDGSTAEGARVKHVFTTAGSFEVTLWVTDSEGLTGEAHQVVEIGEKVNMPPEAVITGPSKGKVGQKLTFRGDESQDDGGEIVRYKWTFGDGSTTTGKNVSHTFNETGTFTVRLVVEDDEGLTDAATHKVTITEEVNNNPPAAVIIGPEEGVVGSELYFRGDESHDDHHDIVQYKWYFGDGAMATSKNATHVYKAAGTYVVKLYVTDGDGLVGKATHEVCVGGAEDKPPVAVIVAPGEAPVGSEVYFRGDESHDDHNNIVYYKWYFGDGTKAYGKNVTHAYQYPGTYTVHLYVRDGGDHWGEAVHEICVGEVANHPPHAVIVGPGEGTAGSELYFRGDESHDDHNDIVLYKWDFGDGSLGDGVNETHVYAKAGTYQITLTVKDGGGLYGTATHTVYVGEPPNEPPVAEIIAPVEGMVGAEIYFRGNESYDDHGSIVCYQWSFGDGSTAEGANVTHAFEAPGTYEVTLRVKDSGGLYGTSAHAIHIG